MAKLSLASRLNAFLKSNAKAGNVALSMTCETIEHAIGGSGDWTLLARLAAKIGPRDKRIVMDCARKVGLSLKDDTSHTEGMRLSRKLDVAKIKGDQDAMAFLASLQVLAGSGSVLQSDAVAELITGQKKEPAKKLTFREGVSRMVAAQVKAGASVADVIVDLEAVIATLRNPVTVQPVAAPVKAPVVSVVAMARKVKAERVSEPAH